jgi:hypothetical protein
VLAADNTLLGLRPRCVDTEQDNLTALELHAFKPAEPNRNLVYCTLRGASFAGNTATIYSYDPLDGPFQPASLQPFALAPSMGLVAADVIDALALSDVMPVACPTFPNRIADPNQDDVLFSLAPGSPSLVTLGVSPATILRSRFNGLPPSVFATPGDLGLSTADDVDAIDIEPVSPSCSVPNAITGLGTFGVNTTGAATSLEQPSMPCTIVQNDVWFAWTSTVTGPVLVTSCGTTAANTAIVQRRRVRPPIAGRVPGDERRDLHDPDRHGARGRHSGRHVHDRRARPADRDGQTDRDAVLRAVGRADRLGPRALVSRPS